MTLDPTPDLIRDRVAALVEAFRQVDRTGMADMPLRNTALSVEAVGFRPWGLDDGPALLGILVTPWSMNVMLLPLDAAAWADQDHGSKATIPLPCGGVEFTAGQVEGFGPYRMCSLFSPMAEFADQAGAVLTAQLALEDLLTEPAAAAPAPEPRRRRTEGPPPEGGPDLSRRAALGMTRTVRGRGPGR